MAKKRVGTRQKKKNEPQRRTALSPAVAKAWEAALNVDDQELARFVPTEPVLRMGEALLAGSTTLVAIADYSGMTEPEVRDTIADPLAMAWVSRQIHQIFRHRAGLVDAALFQAAMRGDVPAIKLFYERMGQLSRVVEHKHSYSGGVKLDTCSDEDLRRIIRENAARLPAEFRIIDQTEAGTDVQGADDPGPEDQSGAPTVLPEPDQEPQETDTVS